MIVDATLCDRLQHEAVGCEDKTSSGMRRQDKTSSGMHYSKVQCD